MMTGAAANGANPILEIDGLKVSFRRGDRWTEVVHDVSFDVQAGETVALVGESGSGKSVTAMSVLGLLSPHQSRRQGRICFKGDDVALYDAKRLRALRGSDVAMIFQEPMTSLNPVMTCGQQIAEALVIHRSVSARAARAEALRLFDRVRISDAARRFNEYPHSLSGGMRQRVMIAMALACKPSLLIADEPTTALDVTIQAQILELIRDLQQEQDMAVLFITHDMGVVAEISDRTVVMANGRVVEGGPTSRIFNSPRENYTRALLSAVPTLGTMSGKSLPERFSLVDHSSGCQTPASPVHDTVQRDGPPLLSVEGLTTRFDLRKGFLNRVSGRIHAVEDVSFELRAGETLALVGESGCGKSTTGRSILRLAPGVEGKVALEGVDVLQLDKPALRAARRDMQMIFQDPFSSLNPRRTVGASLAEPIIVNRLASPSDAANTARDLIRQVGLPDDSVDRYPHEFSGGQRQRVCIARALALRPRLIIADESVSALDVSVKAQVINLMLDLQEQTGVAYLFISHDMAVVERVSHRVAVMYLGEIVEIGDRNSVFTNPMHPYTRKLLAAVPVADPDRSRRPTGIDMTEIRSPIRSADYVRPRRRFKKAGPDHLYMEDAASA